MMKSRSRTFLVHGREAQDSLKVWTGAIEGSPSGNLENMLPIMDHVNRGLDLVVDPQERLRYASYNLQVVESKVICCI